MYMIFKKLLSLLEPKEMIKSIHKNELIIKQLIMIMTLEKKINLYSRLLNGKMPVHALCIVHSKQKNLMP